MMQDRLLKIMLVCSILFTAASMSVMLYYCSTKTIVIAEEAPAGSGGERPAEDVQGNALRFQAGGKAEGVRIPLPDEIRADDIVIENRYIEHSVHIILAGKYNEFYEEHFPEVGDKRVTGGSFFEENGATRLQLELDGVYEHRYVFENGALQLSFAEPGQLYEHIVVVDAACGGRDDGHTGNGIREKDIALQITEKVREKLEDSDIRVYCTRTDDADVSQEERLGFVNELGADMLISVRAAADSENGHTYGIQTFYNATYFIPYFGSAELADLLERNTVTAAGGKANGLFEAEKGDRLLTDVQVPAAAIEVGYVTNKQEASFLAAQEYRDRLAEGIANAVSEAFAARSQNP